MCFVWIGEVVVCFVGEEVFLLVDGDVIVLEVDLMMFFIFFLLNLKRLCFLVFFLFLFVCGVVLFEFGMG